MYVTSSDGNVIVSIKSAEPDRNRNFQILLRLDESEAKGDIILEKSGFGWNVYLRPDNLKTIVTLDDTPDFLIFMFQPSDQGRGEEGSPQLIIDAPGHEEYISRVQFLPHKTSIELDGQEADSIRPSGGGRFTTYDFEEQEDEDDGS